MTASSMSPEALRGLFAGTHVDMQGIVSAEFILGLHRTFWVSFIISVIAAIVAFMRGSYKPVEGKTSA